MIKITDMEKPPELTDEVIKEKTEKFMKNRKTDVWKEPYIMERLLEMSHGKCCYCECKLGKESNWEQIEHYYPKCLYPEEVVSWKNLLPACPRCNTKKNRHDTKKEPIVNPRYDDPSQHFIFYQFFYISQKNSKKGELTCEVLDLNESMVLDVRTKIGNKAIESLHNLYIKARDICGTKTNSSLDKLKLRNGVISLLKEAQPESEYSAMVANSILGHPNCSQLIDYMEHLELWDTEMSTLYETAKMNSLPCDEKRVAPTDHFPQKSGAREA